MYADAMTLTPVDVPYSLFDRMRKIFTPEQLVELTATIGWENYRARFNHAFGMESENFSEGSYCALPAAGQPASTH